MLALTADCSTASAVPECCVVDGAAAQLNCLINTHVPAAVGQNALQQHWYVLAAAATVATHAPAAAVAAAFCGTTRRGQRNKGMLLYGSCMLANPADDRCCLKQDNF